jgi:hypothetical protein
VYFTSATPKLSLYRKKLGPTGIRTPDLSLTKPASYLQINEADEKTLLSYPIATGIPNTLSPKLFGNIPEPYSFKTNPTLYFTSNTREVSPYVNTNFGHNR